MDRLDYKVQLEAHRKSMIVYLKLKTDEEDWHGVQDAASDLREIDSKLIALQVTKKED